MTKIGISITKSFAFRDGTQEFSNVYYYDGLGKVPTEAEAGTLIDEVATREKAIHSTQATFKKGRCWLQTGDKATTVMLNQKALSGTGSGTAEAGMDKERAFCFRLRAGVDSRGNPVYLRKWYHTKGYFGGVVGSNGINENSTGFTQTQRDNLVSAMNTIGSVGTGLLQGVLSAKKDRLPDAGATWSAHKYLEHRQLGDQWRAV